MTEQHAINLCARIASERPYLLPRVERASRPKSDKFVVRFSPTDKWGDPAFQSPEHYEACVRTHVDNVFL